jgi:hypothetical protein
MAKRQVFLQLTPEFGGTKFGPFQGAEIRLGSEPGRNDIVLPEGLGVAPEHARLVKQQDESFILSPVERTAQIFLYRVDGRPAKAVQSPIAVVMGDGFSLVTAEGPRFVIVLEAEKRAAGGADDGGGGALGKAKNKIPGAGSLMEEIKRQGLARALATGAGQFAINAWTFIKSGSFLQPRYIITFLMIAAGWVFGGGAACTAAGAMWQAGAANSQLADAQGQIEEEKRKCGGDPDGEGSEFDEVVYMDRVLRPNGQKASLWKLAFTEDPDFEKTVWAAVQKEYAEIGKDKYKWAWLTKSSAFVEVTKATAGAALDPYTARVLPFVGASEDRAIDAKWFYVASSNGTGSCGYGPAQMTYRQAKNLQFPTIQRDGMIEADVAAGLSEDLTINDDLRKAFKAATTQADKDPIADDAVIQRAGEVDGGSVCMTVGEADASDDRLDMTAKALKTALGPAATGLPKPDSTYGPMARLARYYAADWYAGYDTLKFDQKKSPRLILDQAPEYVPAAQKQWVLDRMARTLARAIAIPCWAKLDKNKESIAKRPKDMTDILPKSEFDCVALGYYASEK